MTLIANFAGSAGRQRIRITKPTTGLVIRHINSALGVVKNGLAGGLPEKISAEITHPSRKRADFGTDLPLGMLALYGQYLRGPIAETRAGELTTTETNFWLNQSSAVEVTSEDQFYVDFVPQPSGEYEIYAPETPLIAPYSSCFLNHELQRMASDLRSKTLYTSGFSALILPNDPDSIERVTVTVNLATGGQKELEYTIRELLSQAQRANPFVAVSTTPHTGSEFLLTQNADYVLMTLNAVASVELHNVLGVEYDYMLVRVNDRNDLG